MEMQAIMGRDADQPRVKDEDGKFTCDYDDCGHRCSDEKDLKLHMKLADDHYYCRRCDFTGQDHEHLTEHKIAAMVPFLYGNTKEPPKHIVCEFCGEEFKSLGGRKRHREQFHQSEQDVKCPGCNSSFTRAAHMVQHLEDGKCVTISKHEFHGRMQHKHVLSQILAAPEVTTSRLNAGHTQSRTAIDGITDGQSLLTDWVDEGQLGGWMPLQPSHRTGTSLTGGELATYADGVNEWPLLGDSPVPDVAIQLSNMVLRGGPPEGEGPPGHGSTGSLKPAGSKQLPPTRDLPETWLQDDPSARLFPDATETPMQEQKSTDLVTRRMTTDNEKNNILATRFWDKSLPGYSAMVYYNSNSGQYHCPFPDCERCFGSTIDIEQHVESNHLRRILACHVCFKRFPKVSALVAHMESAGKCDARKSKTFKAKINELTGGLLEAEPVRQRRLYPRLDSNDGTIGIRDQGGVRGPGVMSMRYRGGR